LGKDFTVQYNKHVYVKLLGTFVIFPQNLLLMENAGKIYIKIYINLCTFIFLPLLERYWRHHIFRLSMCVHPKVIRTYFINHLGIWPDLYTINALADNNGLSRVCSERSWSRPHQMWWIFVLGATVEHQVMVVSIDYYVLWTVLQFLEKWGQNVNDAQTNYGLERWWHEGILDDSHLVFDPLYVEITTAITVYYIYKVIYSTPIFMQLQLMN